MVFKQPRFQLQMAASSKHFPQMAQLGVKISKSSFVGQSIGIRQGWSCEQEADGNRSVAWVSAKQARLRPHTSSVFLPQAPLTPPNMIWRQWVQLHGSHGGQRCSSGSATHTLTAMIQSLPPFRFFMRRGGVITLNLSDDALISPAGNL